MRILTWNIGSFIFLRYVKFYKKNSERFEYFNSAENAKLINGYIKKLDPDVIFLQEFYNQKDSETIELLSQYPYKKILNMWYGDGRALFASKSPFTSAEKNSLICFNVYGYNIVPIHLNSYYSKKRFEEVTEIKRTFLNTDKLILLGDFNIWNRNKFYIFKNDIKSMSILKSFLLNVSENIKYTTYLGYALDKIFISEDVKTINNVKMEKVRGKYMDHYPIYIDIK